MDMVPSHKDKLAYFRIKELKDILTQLGLSKQGKKQDLVDRILAILSDERVSGMWAKKNAVAKEQVAKLVDDTYRKMQVTGAPDLASKSEGVSDSTYVHVNVKEEYEDSYQKQKIRCLCGSSLPTDSTIKCEEPKCKVQQHIRCVIIPEKLAEGIPPILPGTFYCEICRLSRADPFWVTVSHPLYPVKLNITNVPTDGSNPGLSIEKTFQLSRADRDMLSKQDYDVQAWCMLLNDKVTFRMQWPQYTDLHVNGVSVRAINRPGSQLLGANGRDDGAVITPCTKDGINKISLTGCDSRIFCLGVRIAKRRTLNQVLNMVPKEGEGESFEDALARVRRCVGGPPTENADSDSDIEVVADSIPVNLRCPMSGMRMKVAGRFKPCVHMGCFDLDVFVEMNQRSRKWQCPICLKNYSLEKIIVDPYFNRITSKFQSCGEDISEIEVKPDGSWRAKPEGDRKVLGELGLWHFPDGAICPPIEAESKLKQELKPIKQEVGSESSAGLKLGMKKNQNGCWVFNKPDDVHGGQNVIPMSISATRSGKDFEDVSVNQDFQGRIDFSPVNGIDFEPMFSNTESMHGFNNQIAFMPPGNAEVIVLSDSDEEIEPLLSNTAVYHHTPQPGIHDSNYGATGRDQGRSSCLDIYGAPGHDDGFGNMWPMPSGSSGFQLFGSDVSIVDMQNGSLNCSTSISPFTQTADNTVIGSTPVMSESTALLSNMNDDFVDNHLAYNGDDPSLQIFLPSRPLNVSKGRSDLTQNEDVSNGARGEDWISLRIGDSGELARSGAASVNVPTSGKQIQSNDDVSTSVVDTGESSLLGKNNRAAKIIRETSGSPFSFPRQKRSVRPRLQLSIGSPSE